MKDVRCILGMHDDQEAPADRGRVLEQGHAMVECARCGRVKTIKLSSTPASRGGNLGQYGGGSSA